jgi:hypothetical protein
VLAGTADDEELLGRFGHKSVKLPGADGLIQVRRVEIAVVRLHCAGFGFCKSINTENSEDTQRAQRSSRANGRLKKLKTNLR